MAASPLSARHGAVAVPVGTTLLLIGGSDDTLCPPNADCAIAPVPLRGGATYDPRADRWRRVAPAPTGIPAATPTATIGTAVYFLVPGVDDVPTFHRYDTATDRWTTLPSPQGRYLQLVATGSSVVAYPTSHESPPTAPDQLFDPRTTTWRALPDDPLVPSFDRTMVWAEDRLVLLAPRLVPSPGGEDGPSYLRAATYSLTTGIWTTLPETNQVVSGELMPVWTGSQVLNPVPGGVDGGETNNYGRTIALGGRLDLATGTWSRLPDAPDRYQGWGVGAAGTRYSAVGSIVLDHQRDRWLRLTAPQDAPEQGHAAAWVGDALVVWGGGRFDSSASVLSASGSVWEPAAT
jgi:hypothetical protein